MGAPELIDSCINDCIHECELQERWFVATRKYRELDNARRDTKPGAERTIANRKAIDALVRVMELEKEMEGMRP